MKPQESIIEMTNRLNVLLTNLKKLGKHYSKEEINTKIQRILPKKDWKSRVTSIEEAHDLSKLSIEILIGKLLTHELTLKQRKYEKEEKDEKKKIALKGSQDASNDESLVDSSEEDDEIAMITRTFKKLLRRKKFSRQREQKE